MNNHEHKGGVVLKQLDEDGTGLARIATLGVVDLDGDFTEPGAFGEQEVTITPAHDWRSVPLGRARIFERGNEALAKFTLNLETQAGREWYAALKFDFDTGRPLQKWSYGFTILEAGEDTRDGRRVRILKRLEVHEISPVVRGSGVDTATLAIKGSKSFGNQIDAMIAEVGDIVSRAKDIAALREAEGRGLSPERLDQIAALRSRLGEIVRLCKEIDAMSEKTTNAEAGRLLASFEATRSGRGRRGRRGS